MKSRRILVNIIIIILIFVGFTAFFSAKWYINKYGEIGFSAIIFTLLSPLEGTDSSLIKSWIKCTLAPAILSTFVICIAILYRSSFSIEIERLKVNKIFRIYPFSRVGQFLLCFLICFTLLFQAAKTVAFSEWLVQTLDRSTIYEDEYVDPNTVNITFPSEKRNLIYIMLESMETSYLSEDLGGGRPYNIIPELYTLAMNNTNFSHNDSIGSYPKCPDATWTIAAMVAQTSGIPLSIPIGGNSYGNHESFLPGVTSITDLLHNNGYYQTLMVGSDAAFGGRSNYYTQHGIDYIYDWYTAETTGAIPDDYHVWWGFEDLYLFEYAKQELTDIAANDEPFSFTMLTVDTHHVGGYVCSECENQFESQYENVISCSSRQVSSFVEWIQQQDFYENTTIIICGDHLSMDAGYFDAYYDSDYVRHGYNCIINSPASTSVENTKNRDFSPMDMFPTTLAALGCEIEGDRLGLGTNLYSDVPTLAEQYGSDVYYSELKKTSAYYLSNFVTD